MLIEYKNKEILIILFAAAKFYFLLLDKQIGLKEASSIILETKCRSIKSMWPMFNVKIEFEFSRRNKRYNKPQIR